MKQLHLANIKAQVFASTHRLIQPLNNLTTQISVFVEGLKGKQPSTDEYYTENDTCVGYALRFIIEELYKNTTKVFPEVGYIC